MNNIVQVVGQNGQQLNAGCPGAADLGFERGPWVENRRYRDSAYAVLAAMYSLLRPDVHHLVKTAQIEAEMRHFTDHDIRFDYRNRKQGAFKAMDQLVKWNLVYKQRGIGKALMIVWLASQVSTLYTLYCISGRVRWRQLLLAHSARPEGVLPAVPREVHARGERGVCAGAPPRRAVRGQRGGSDPARAGRPACRSACRSACSCGSQTAASAAVTTTWRWRWCGRCRRWGSLGRRGWE